MNILQCLLKSSVHLGHLKASSHPKMKAYLYGRRQGRDLIDLRISLSQLKVARKLVQEIHRKEGRILFYVQHPDFAPIFSSLFPREKNLLYTQKWMGGTLTNWGQLLKEAHHYLQGEKVFSNPDKEGTFKRKFQPFLPLLQDAEESLKCLQKHPPDLLVLFPVKGAKIPLDEANRIRIPTLGIVDSDTDPSLVTYPIPGNDEHLKALYLYAKLILSGLPKKERKEKEIQKDAIQK